MRLDHRFCEVQPARALYRRGVNNGGCIYESEEVRSGPFTFVPLGRILRAATCNLQSGRMPALDPLPGGQPAFCEPQSASCRPSARCTSQIAARRIDARHVRMVSTELLGLAANPRAAIREPQSASCGPVASRSSQIAARSIEARHVLRHDCSSQSTARSSQTVAQAVLFLRSQRAPRSSQGADFCAGGPRLTLFSSRRIADRTVADRSTLVRRSRLTLFSSRRIADRTVADRSTLARRSRQRSTVVRTLAVRWSQGAGV